MGVEKKGDACSFVSYEVTLGTEDNEWVAVNFLMEIDSQSKFAFINGYFLMTEMKKGEAEHSH